MDWGWQTDEQKRQVREAQDALDAVWQPPAQPTTEQVTALLPDGWVAYDFGTAAGAGRWAAYFGGITAPSRAAVRAETVAELVAAVRYRASLPHDLACCPSAKLRNCVCYVSFDCPTHWRTCVGSHD